MPRKQVSIPPGDGRAGSNWWTITRSRVGGRRMIIRSCRVTGQGSRAAFRRSRGIADDSNTSELESDDKSLKLPSAEDDAIIDADVCDDGDNMISADVTSC